MTDPRSQEILEAVEKINAKGEYLIYPPNERGWFAIKRRGTVGRRPITLNKILALAAKIEEQTK